MPESLRRSTTDRHVAGVAGGLGREFGIDPVVFRVLFAVLTVFGGLGLLAYAVLWLILPEDGSPQSEAQRLRAGGRAPGSLLPAAVAVVGAFVLAGWLGHGPGLSGAAVLVVAVLLAVALTRREVPAPTVAHQAAPPTFTPAPVRRPHRPRRPPSVLGPATISAAALVAGGLVLAGIASDSFAVPAAVVIAAALAVVGLGLLAGAWWGRSRGLLVAGVALTLALAATSSFHAPFRGGTGSLVWQPRTVAALLPTYRLGAGDATLDLTQLPLDGTHRKVRVSVGAGEILVELPRSVDVTVHAQAGIGEIDVLGATADGLGVDRTVVDDVDPPGGERLDLDLEVGTGHVEVRRA